MAKKATTKKTLVKGPAFQEPRGAAWKKETVKGKKMISFRLDEDWFSAFHNDSKYTKRGKVVKGKEKSPDFFCCKYETRKDGSVWSIPVGGMYNGVYEKDGEKREIIRLILEQRFVLIPNPRKTQPKHPDYQIFLSYTDGKTKGKAWNSTSKPKMVKPAKKKAQKLPLKKAKK
jgi:uncharacterized protein (DUF736 family)